MKVPYFINNFGIGGQLLVFFKCVLVYFLCNGIQNEDIEEHEMNNWDDLWKILIKCAPIVCLWILVVLKGAQNSSSSYSRQISFGLFWSCLGDAFLTSTSGESFGILSFSLAHLFYSRAYMQRAGNIPKWGICLLLVGLLYGLWLYKSGGTILVPMYALVICASTCLGSACARDGTTGGKSAAVGCILFVISDSILGYSMYAGPLPYRRVLVMSTYYAAQLGIATSALYPLP